MSFVLPVWSKEIFSQGGGDFPACITGNMTGRSASRVGSAFRGGLYLGGLYPGSASTASRWSASRGSSSCGLPPVEGGASWVCLKERLGRIPGSAYKCRGWPDSLAPKIHGIQSTSGRYASYWNAFLFVVNLIPWKLSVGKMFIRVALWYFHQY